MSTFVVVNTYAHSVTYISDNILRSMKHLIIMIGLDPRNLVNSWNTLDLGLQTWIKSRHLEGATIEFYNSKNGSLLFRWDFGIDYSYGSGTDGDFWVDTTPIKNAIYKAGISIVNCLYEIKLKNKPGRPDVQGFSPCSYRSTEGFVMQSVGTTIGTNYLGSQSTYWRKI